MRLLNGLLVLEGLPDFEVDLIAVHDALGDGEDVGDQAIKQIHRHGLAYDNTQDLGSFFLGWQRVVCVEI